MLSGDHLDRSDRRRALLSRPDFHAGDRDWAAFLWGRVAHAVHRAGNRDPELAAILEGHCAVARGRGDIRHVALKVPSILTVPVECNGAVSDGFCRCFYSRLIGCENVLTPSAKKPIGVSTGTESDFKTENNCYEGKVDDVFGDDLTSTCGQGEEHHYTVAEGATTTCNGKASELSDIREGLTIRMSVCLHGK